MKRTVDVEDTYNPDAESNSLFHTMFQRSPVLVLIVSSRSLMPVFDGCVQQVLIEVRL